MSRTLIAVLLLLPSVVLAEAVTDVRVFTTSYLNVSDSRGVAKATYQLDEVDRALAEFGTSLPATFAQAEIEARRRLNSPRGVAAMQRLQAGFEGVVMAWSHGIDRLPAILINDRYLIYGVADVDEALRLFAVRMP